MSRWRPDGKDRLQDAALELFAARGYAETTVAAVAEHAGLTPRTFFRYFPDKKEVLFSGEDLAETVRTAAAASTAPSALGMAMAGLRAVAAEIQTDPSRVRRRAAVIAATPELREREMLKISRWTGAVVDALASQDVEPRAARIAAAVATALFRIAYADWTGSASRDDLVTTLDELLEVHYSVTSSVPRASAAGQSTREADAR